MENLSSASYLYKKYSYKFGRMVVQKYMKEHARATTYLHTRYGIKEQKVIRLFCIDQPSWQSYKKMVVKVENAIKQCDKFGIDTKNYLTFVEAWIEIEIESCRKRWREVRPLLDILEKGGLY